MKILLVAMNSIHFVRWTEQLKDSGHEVFWFDILDMGRSAQLPWVNQIISWKQKYPNFKGRYFIKKHIPWLYKLLSFFTENNTARSFEKVLQDVNPDIVHSMVLYISCAPILEVMKKNLDIPWVYSSWGSDLYYFKNFKRSKEVIQNTLPKINYLITDCKRDIGIAKDLGFTGEVLGTFPGGGGFNYESSEKYILPVEKRKTILVKGYQGRSGRCMEVLKALKNQFDRLKEFDVIVFAADDEVVSFINKKNLNNLLSLKVYPRNNFLPHKEILKLMGEALIYIGNSNSDGIPNTLLEAIAQGAFPIQSNPGGASAEVIEHGKSGLLIEDFNDSIKIGELIYQAVSSPLLLQRAFEINQNKIKPQFEREKIKLEVLEAYKRAYK